MINEPAAYKIGALVLTSAVLAAEAVVQAAVPLPAFDAMAIYSSFGSVSLMLPVWQDEYRGGRRSLFVVATGLATAALVGPAVAEHSSLPYAAAASAAVSALVAPAVLTNPGFAFEKAVAMIETVMRLFKGSGK